jgi:hypothetical protein
MAGALYLTGAGQYSSRPSQPARIQLDAAHTTDVVWHDRQRACLDRFDRAGEMAEWSKAHPC